MVYLRCCWHKWEISGNFIKAFKVVGVFLGFFAFILEAFVCPTADILFPALVTRPIKCINVP